MNISSLAAAAGDALTSDGAGVAADAVMAAAVCRLRALNLSPDPELSIQMIDTAILIGDGTRADELLTALDLDSLDPESIDIETAALIFRAAQRNWSLGNGDEAMADYELLLQVFTRLGREREVAVTMGKIADIYQARGDLDAALRIRTEEQLPVFDRLGDVREKAMTMGKIADIYEARGDLDAALRIRTEEQLPVYERLGDVRSESRDHEQDRRHLLSGPRRSR